MPFNAPNLLTLLRILLIPLFVALFYLPTGWLTHHQVNFVATAVFGLAALTDWFDGWLARRLIQTSAFGAFLDPVADKLMVATALVVLVAIVRVHPIIAVIIIGREITISALREWMAKLGDHKSVAVSFLGKIKTISQMVAIVLLLAKYQCPKSQCQSLKLGRANRFLDNVISCKHEHNPNVKEEEQNQFAHSFIPVTQELTPEASQEFDFFSCLEGCPAFMVVVRPDPDLFLRHSGYTQNRP